MLWQIRVPAALPALASGLRVAAAVAPIGAVIGEWVGSSAGLGYLMLHANARMQVDLMFAALLVLAAMALALCVAVDRAGPARWSAGSPSASSGEKSTLPVDPPRLRPARSPSCSGRCRRPGAADKLTVMLDWFVNPDHGPLVDRPREGLLRRRRASTSS